MTVPSVADMHEGLLEMLRERTRVEPVILSAKAGMGGLDLALHVDEDNHYLLDPVAAGGDSRVLIHKLTRQVIESLQSLPVEALRDPGREGDAARLTVARYYEGDTQEALHAALEVPESDWTLTRALGPNDRVPLVLVCDAHRLPTHLLWELRELAGHGVRLLMLTHDGAPRSLNDVEAPFYGNSVWIDMPTLSLPVWMVKLEDEVQVPQESLHDMLGQVRYRTAAALEVLGRAEDGESQIPLAFAWFQAVDARMGEARLLAGIAENIHELAPKLLLALATGQAPYAAMPDERSDRIALALRRLQSHDLVEQPAKREWQISDPFMSAALARLQGHKNAVELYPQEQAT
jgi:hypothetical protein